MKNYDNQNCEILSYIFLRYIFFVIDSINCFLFYLSNTDLDIR